MSPGQWIRTYPAWIRPLASEPWLTRHGYGPWPMKPDLPGMDMTPGQWTLTYPAWTWPPISEPWLTQHGHDPPISEPWLTQHGHDPQSVNPDLLSMDTLQPMKSDLARMDSAHGQWTHLPSMDIEPPLASEARLTSHGYDSRPVKPDLPSMDMIPQANHSIRLRPTLPDPSATPAGDTNIPEPEDKCTW